MTKETKIGLLVGLAFIVLFAIILSEKGTPHRDGRVPQFTMADSSKNGTNLSAEQPLGDKGRLPVDGQLAPIITPSPTQPPATYMPIEEERVAQQTIEEESLPSFPPELVNSLNLAPLKEQPKSTSDTAFAMDDPEEAPSRPAVVMGPLGPAPSMTPASPTARKQNLLTPAVTAKSEPSKEELARIAKQTEIKYKTVHQVEAGESLTRIAAKQYGRSTPERVDALFNANRDVLKTPANVRAGDKLKIPDLGDQFEAAPDFPASNANKTIMPVRVTDQTLRIPIPVTEKPKGETKLALVPVTKMPATRTQSDKIAMKTPVEKTATRTPIAETKPDGKQLDSKVALKKLERAAKKPGSADKKKKDEAIAFVWYEVKKTDTLSKIAKKEMGSERDTSALYKINQDIISKPNTIRPGMKIRVPAKISGTSEVPSAITSRGLDVTDD